MVRLTAGLILSLSTLASLASAADPPTVDLGYVTYAGFTNDTAEISYYYGIPYAQPPLGDLRWRAPRPIEASNNFTGQTVNATSPPLICYQSAPPGLVESGNGNFVPFGPDFYFQNILQSEDCLVLNVKAPQNPSGDSLPVFVVLHGGGFTLGSPELVQPGDAIVHKSNGSLIVVEVQYRLGLFGFLAGSEVKEQGDLNVGLLDQRAALYWVQRHIKAFGGDPSRVTIWGGSAGGSSVTFHLTAGGAFDQPPFSAAIPEYPWWGPLLSGSVQEHQFRTALRISDCADLACLRTLDSSALQLANQRVLNASYPGPQFPFGSFYWGPVIDGAFVRQLPSDAFKQGRFHKVPLLVDRDAYEGFIFSNATAATPGEAAADARRAFPAAGPAFLARLDALYPPAAYNSSLFRRQAWFGDFMVNCPARAVATAFADRAANASAVFKLVFAAGAQVHGATTPFLASRTVGFPDAGNATLADFMSAYWISFAATGDPNPLRDPRAPFWPSYRSGGEVGAEGESVGFSVLKVNEAGIEVLGDPDDSAACDFFSAESWTVSN